MTLRTASRIRFASHKEKFMASRVPVYNLSVEEYLEVEQDAPVRHEYVAGQIYAMAGASDEHNTIALNVATLLRSHVRGGPCRVYISDMKVRIEITDVFYYPDVLVTCDPEDTGRYAKTRPVLIVEVTSPPTTVTDHREKLLAYQKLPSLREYVTIAQHEMRVEIYRRDKRGHWWLETYGPEHSFELESVNLEIAVKDVYEDVVLRPWPADEPEPPVNPG
jgi:Uma2 family endonuclease